MYLNCLWWTWTLCVPCTDFNLRFLPSVLLRWYPCSNRPGCIVWFLSLLPLLLPSLSPFSIPSHPLSLDVWLRVTGSPHWLLTQYWSWRWPWISDLLSLPPKGWHYKSVPPQLAPWSIFNNQMQEYFVKLISLQTSNFLFLLQTNLSRHTWFTILRTMRQARTKRFPTGGERQGDETVISYQGFASQCTQ